MKIQEHIKSFTDFRKENSINESYSYTPKIGYDVSFDIDMEDYEDDLLYDNRGPAIEVSFLGTDYYITDITGKWETYDTDLEVILEPVDGGDDIVMNLGGSYGRGQWAEIDDIGRISTNEWEGTGSLRDPLSIILSTLVKYVGKAYIDEGYVVAKTVYVKK